MKLVATRHSWLCLLRIVACCDATQLVMFVANSSLLRRNSVGYACCELLLVATRLSWLCLLRIVTCCDATQLIMLVAKSRGSVFIFRFFWEKNPGFLKKKLNRNGLWPFLSDLNIFFSEIRVFSDLRLLWNGHRPFGNINIRYFPFDNIRNWGVGGFTCN